VDTSGNVLVTGNSASASGADDYLTIRYSAAGVALWTNRFGSGAFRGDYARAVAVDANGNVFVTGESGSGSAGYDYVTIKYSSAGVPLWTNVYAGTLTYNDYPKALVLDGSGNVIVTGESDGGSSGYDYATVKYSNAGVLLWANRYNGPGNSADDAGAMAADAGGNVFVTGVSAGTGYNQDIATIAYATSGAPLWTNRYDGPDSGADQANAIAVDGWGNVYVAGSSYSSASYSDYVTIKYSGTGVPLWTNRYSGFGTGYGYAQAVAVDAGGTVYVTGYWVDSASSADYLTLAYSSSGTLLWTARYNGPANGGDMPQTTTSLVLGPGGAVHVTGISDGELGLGTTYDFLTVKYLAPPLITSTFLNGANFVFGGVGGTAGSNYYVLASTNVGAVLTNWVRVATNTFGAGGTFSVTNAVAPAKPRQFFRLQVP
jgi:hypothetical protein